MRNLLLTLALFTFFAGSSFAQTATTPDFSGTWKINLPKSTIPKKTAPPRSDIVTITNDGDTIQFHYSADPKDRSYTYIVDGEEHPLGIWVENDSPRFVKATWEKSVLVIEYILRATAQDVIHDTERWSLSSDGKTLTKGFEGKSKLAYVFDKQ
jgi:hypothetical protein